MWLADWQLCRDSARIDNIILHMYVYFWIWALDAQWFSILLSAPPFWSLNPPCRTIGSGMQDVVSQSSAKETR